MSKMLMAAHFAAFSARVASATVKLEVKEDQTDLAKIIERIGKGFEEYKSANDERLKELATKGAVDPTTKAKLDKLDAELDGLSELKRSVEALAVKASRPNGGGEGHVAPEKKAYHDAFITWMRNPADPQATMNLRTASKGLEQRAAQVVTTTGSAGGFALPEQIENTIARLSRDITPMRQVATVRTIGSSDYKELFDVNGGSFEWVGEGGTRSQTTTPDLAEIAPTMGTASARPRASEESLDDLFFDVEGWLSTATAEALAQGEGLAFVSGNGTNRPTGFLAGPTPLLTADGVRAFGTLQAVVGGQAAALPTSLDTIINMTATLRARYRANAVWAANRRTLAALRVYKDTTGQYLWQPSVQAGTPDTFMGYRVVEMEDMPDVAAGTFPLAFGDFREGYLIVDRVGLRVTRDDITLPGFVQWYIRRRVGGRIRNSEAIKLLRISAT